MEATHQKPFQQSVGNLDEDEQIPKLLIIEPTVVGYPRLDDFWNKNLISTAAPGAQKRPKSKWENYEAEPSGFWGPENRTEGFHVTIRHSENDDVNCRSMIGWLFARAFERYSCTSNSATYTFS